MLFKITLGDKNILAFNSYNHQVVPVSFWRLPLLVVCFIIIRLFIDAQKVRKKKVSFRWSDSDKKSRKIIFFLLTPRCCSSVVLSIKQNFHMFFVAQRTKRSVFYGAGCFWRLPLLAGQKKIGENFFSPISNYWDFITCSTSCPIDSTRFSRTAWHKARLCYTRLFAARAIDREFCFTCSTSCPIRHG